MKNPVIEAMLYSTQLAQEKAKEEAKREEEAKRKAEEEKKRQEAIAKKEEAAKKAEAAKNANRKKWIVPYSSSGSFLGNRKTGIGRAVARQTNVRDHASDAVGGGLLGFAVGIFAENMVEEAVEQSLREILLDSGAGEFFGTFDELLQHGGRG